MGQAWGSSTCGGEAGGGLSALPPAGRTGVRLCPGPSWRGLGPASVPAVPQQEHVAGVLVLCCACRLNGSDSDFYEPTPQSTQPSPGHRPCPLPVRACLSITPGGGSTLKLAGDPGAHPPTPPRQDSRIVRWSRCQRPPSTPQRGLKTAGSHLASKAPALPGCVYGLCGLGWPEG